MAAFLTTCKERYVALRGFHTSRHFVIIESDDWGSIRMPSAAVFQKLQECGDKPERDAFLRSDCLENEADLSALFDVLTSVHDKSGMPAVLTANFAMANPDFQKIDLMSGAYFYEPFYETYRRYYPDQDVLDCVRKGISAFCLVPQLHCREHMNVSRWITDLQHGKHDTLLAFQNRMIGVGTSFCEENPFGYMDAFNSNFSPTEAFSKILREAMELFEAVFGRKSETFVASCFVWDDELEKALAGIGVRGIQCGYWQNIPSATHRTSCFRRRLHFCGQRNRLGQTYTVRNCSYEPSYFRDPEKCAETCFSQILSAFENRKPAIINSHRFNFVGSIDPANAEENLKWLARLLQKIAKDVPDVEFISTAQLIDIMRQEKT